MGEGMKKGDKYWIIENGRIVTPIEILSVSGNLVTIRTEKGCGMRLPRHRLFESEEEAESKVPKPEKKRKTQYDYM